MEDALFGPAAASRPEIEAHDGMLVEAARTDAYAFGLLYERYHARVYRYVFHRLGNAADAEDVTAMVFVKALEGLPQYRPQPAGFGPWIFRIARNAVIDHYRRGRKQSPLTELDGHVGDRDPILTVLEGERARELQALVEYLSADQRDVVLMRYAADLSFAEIAAALGKKEPAVRMLLHRGLRKLKAVLDDA